MAEKGEYWHTSVCASFLFRLRHVLDPSLIVTRSCEADVFLVVGGIGVGVVVGGGGDSVSHQNRNKREEVIPRQILVGIFSSSRWFPHHPLSHAFPFYERLPAFF